MAKVIDASNKRTIGADGAILLIELGTEVVGADDGSQNSDDSTQKTFASLDTDELPEWDYSNHVWKAAGSHNDRNGLNLSPVMSPGAGQGWWLITAKAAANSAFGDAPIGTLWWVTEHQAGEKDASSAGKNAMATGDKARRVRWAWLSGARSIEFTPTSESVSTAAAGDPGESSRSIRTARNCTLTGIWDLGITAVQRAAGVDYTVFNVEDAKTAAASREKPADAGGDGNGGVLDASTLNIAVLKQKNLVAGVRTEMEVFWELTPQDFPRGYQFGNEAAEFTVTFDFGPGIGKGAPDTIYSLLR